MHARTRPHQLLLTRVGISVHTHAPAHTQAHTQTHKTRTRAHARKRWMRGVAARTCTSCSRRTMAAMPCKSMSPRRCHICAGTRPHLRRDSPTSAPGLAHICAGTRPHLRWGLQGGSSTIVLPGFNDTKKLFMQMKRRGVHACRQCTLVHLHPRVCAHVHTCTHASTHARTMCAHA